MSSPSVTDSATPVSIAVIRSVHNGKPYHSKLLRCSFRDPQGRGQKKTLANLSHLSDPAIDQFKAHLAGRSLVDPSEAFRILRSRTHGRVLAACQAFRQLGLPQLLASQPCLHRDLACAMIAARILRPQTKLATARWWHFTSPPDFFDLRHLAAGGLVLLDLNSSYFEGAACPLARFGHNRDGTKGKLQVNFGLLCEPQGRPVAVSVFEGNVSDPRTVLPAVRQLRRRFGLQRVVLVGDRGMQGQTRIDQLRELDGIDWITAQRAACGSAPC